MLCQQFNFNDFIMFNKIRENRYINKHIKISVDKVIERFIEIRKISDILCICPKPMGNSWQGVHNATIALFPHNTFAIPQYFSNPIYSNKELQQISDGIAKLDYHKIVFTGFPHYFKLFIELLNGSICKNHNSADVYIIYFGSLASNSEDNIAAQILKEILELNKKKIVNRIGFAKKGMSETLKKVANIEAHHIIQMTIPIEREIFIQNINTSALELGVFTHDLYRKNIHNQIAAALMFPESKVHIHKDYGFDYLYSNQRLFAHPFFETYDDFLQLLGSMDLNFYVSFSECFGLIITESLSMGVPCLAADNSGIFDYNDYLKKMLIVNEFDDSNAIYLQALKVIENKEEISRKGVEYITSLNKIAKEKLNLFLST